MHVHSLVAAAGLLALATACTEPAAPPPRSVPSPVPAPRPLAAPAPMAAPLAADWRDWPLTPGTWGYRQDGRGSIALFGVAGEDAVLTLRCDVAAGALYLSRRGDVGGEAAMTVRTTSLTRTLTTSPTGGTPPYRAVSIAPRDALLEAVGYSRGRFVVQQAGYPLLVVPAWAEILRVAEDCRG